MKQKWILAGLLGAAAAYGDTSKLNQDFMQMLSSSMARMDRDMAAASMSGNADHDFAVMMLPHHQGAIDMAKAELSFGKDPVMRRLAQEMIVDQESEIEAMNLWLKKNAFSTAKEK